MGTRECYFYVMNFKYYDGAVLLTVHEWYERLCYQNLKLVRDVLNITNIKCTEDDASCEVCFKGKMHRLPFDNSGSMAS